MPSKGSIMLIIPLVFDCFEYQAKFEVIRT
jgi:hypothetical protein